MGLNTISIIYSEQGTIHRQIEVVEQKQLRMMRFGKRGGWQGARDMSRPDRPVFPYQRAFRALVHTMDEVKTFLSIGVGTGTALHSLLAEYPDAVLQGVEIDQTVLDVAIHYFDAPNHRRADYWVGDGIAFLRADLPMRYDMVFIDAFMRNDIYQPALSPEVIQALPNAITAHGVVVYNVIGFSMRHSTLGSFTEAAKQNFAHVMELPVGLPFSDQNRLVILTNDDVFIKRARKRMGEVSVMGPLERIWWPVRLRRL